MGCSSAREKLEAKMLALKFRRIDIKQEREEKIETLSRIEGFPIIRQPVKDFLIIEKSNTSSFNTGKNNNKIIEKSRNNNHKNKNNKNTIEYSTEDKTSRRNNNVKSLERNINIQQKIDKNTKQKFIIITSKYGTHNIDYNDNYYSD